MIVQKLYSSAWYYGKNHGTSNYFKEDETKGEGDEDFNVVSFKSIYTCLLEVKTLQALFH